MIHASVVPVQRNWAVIGRHDHVEVAVVVEIGVGAAARDLGRREGGADQLRDIAELPAAFVVEQVRRLGIAHARFDARYGRVNVAVGDEQVEPAVQVHVEKEASKSQRQSRGLPYRRTRSLVNKEPVPFIPV